MTREYYTNSPTIPQCDEGGGINLHYNVDSAKFFCPKGWRTWKIKAYGDVFPDASGLMSLANVTITESIEVR